MGNVRTNNIHMRLGKETGFASQFTSDPNISISHTLLKTNPNAMLKKEMGKNICRHYSPLATKAFDYYF